ncbi:TAXI family TRAP transporter solute-binding subunit [Methylocapsa acidiphila]|uniref:TAXI family TRAP transporter solute-binding subunit n=1 Tax=Methylocapsa acidiphila TaxID=133552 RepID=UPI00040A7522|nr:TAXI family TRAP transporter solute-binding subunit [Methylocapsa acidiphila]
MRALKLAAAGGAFVVIGALGAAVYSYERPTVLRVAVTRASADQAIFAAAAQELAQDKTSIRLKPVVVETLAESARALEDQRADLAVVRSDVAMPSGGQTVLIMRRNAALLVAPASSEARSIEDLRGKKVGVLLGEEVGKTGGQSLLDAALAQYDVPSASVRKVALALEDLPSAISHGEVDAVLVIEAPGSAAAASAIAAIAEAGGGAPNFIPIAEAKAIAQRSPNFEAMEVTRGAFGGAQPRPAADLDTLGASTRLVARHSLDNQTVAELTRLLLDERPDIAVQVPVANRIEAPPTDKGAALPVHPGTIAYLDDEEKGFFETYSDFIYIGAMILSLFGTGAAAVVAKLNRRQGEDFERILLRLMEIIRHSREAARLDALDELEREADELLAMALALDASHALSGNRLAATGLALNQVRHAIADRRRFFEAPVRTRFAPRLVNE